MSLNNCTFQGRLGNNPEITTLPSGKERVRFSIAVDRDYKGEDGKRPTDWIAVTMWRGAAYCRKTNLAKGDSVVVTGRMENHTWTDENGQQRSLIGLNCASIYLAGKKDSEKKQGTTEANVGEEMPGPAYDAGEDLPF